MWSPTEFSYRKFKRKADRVGYWNAVVYAVELLSRKTVLWPVVDRLCDRGAFDVASRADLHTIAEPLLSVTDETEAYGALAAPFVASTAPGYVFTETGLVTTPDGTILNESLFPPDRGRRFVIAKLIWQLFFESTRLTTALARKDVRRLDTQATSLEVAAPLIPRYSDNYYHWLVETVPTIRYLQAFEAKTGLDVTYLVPGDAPPWLEETLELLDVPDDTIERASSSVYRADRLVLPSFPLQNRRDFEWIVDTVLENANPDRDRIEAGRNVYISRSKAVERRVVNEDEVMETLSEYGFRRYHLEDLSVAENVTLFHEADVIVGAHGAGLTDLIYCDDATVIELFGSMVKDPYERLADAVGIEYEAIECRPEATDLYVDTDELERTVARQV